MVLCEPGDRKLYGIFERAFESFFCPLSTVRCPLFTHRGAMRVAILKNLSSLERPFEAYTVGVLEVAAHRYAVGYTRYAHGAVF